MRHSYYLICDDCQVVWVGSPEKFKCPQCGKGERPCKGDKESPAIYPDHLAEMMKRLVGENYRPANGTEGECFMNAWCAHCAKDRTMSEGRDLDDCSYDEMCKVIAQTLVYDVDDPRYPPEWQYGPDGQPKCTAFIPNGEELPPVRCEKTIDMFGGFDEQRP